MNFEEKIVELLKENMSERGFLLWKGINERIPNIWNKPSSSTGKYHNKEDGRVPSIAEHTYEMLYTAIKMMRMFNWKKNSSQFDVILFSLVLHDCFKRGQSGKSKHTYNQHDKMAGDMVLENAPTFTKIFSEEEFAMIEEAVRYHNGRWSWDCKDRRNTFKFDGMHIESFYVHLLDMLSANNMLNVPK